MEEGPLPSSLPPHPPSLPLPHPPWPFLQCSVRGVPGWPGGGGTQGWRGRALQAALGARPTSGGIRSSCGGEVVLGFSVSTSRRATTTTQDDISCQGPPNGGLSNGGASRSGLVLPFLSFFVLFRRFWDFPDFSGIFPICSGMVRGFSRFVPFLFLGLLRAPTRNSPERVRDTIWTFPKKVGNTRVWKPPGLASVNDVTSQFLWCCRVSVL